MAHRRTKEEFEIAAKQSQNIAGMCRHMGLKPCGGNYRIMHNAIKEFGLDTSHFTGQGWNVGFEILVNGSTYQSSNSKEDSSKKESRKSHPTGTASYQRQQHR